MHKRFTSRFFVAIFCIYISAYFPQVLAQGKTHTDPAPIGTAVKSIIQVGPMNTINYDVDITVLETARGEIAAKKLQTNNAAPVPDAGFEYLLARIRFTLKGRAVSDTGTFQLGSSPFQWVAYSSDFRSYQGLSITPPEPPLQGAIKSGETREGWVVFAVERSEQQPVLVFDPASGGAMGRGSKLFFRLY